MATPRHYVREWAGAACRWLGATLLASSLVAYAYGTLVSRWQLARFQADHAETISWAPGRVEAYRRALRVALPAPEAVLRIPSANLEVPVVEGTSALVLNRAAGHLTGTSPLGGIGNVVIAGHRDGFFRRLKNVSVGDQIQLARAGGLDTYRVDRLDIVDRNDTSALQPSKRPALTLVTCYPFFYLGAAPQRYIVHASLVPPSSLHTL